MDESKEVHGFKWLSWTLRLFILLLALFLGYFSFEVFGQGYGFWKVTLAFVLHSIPSIFLLLVIAIAWQWEHIAGLLLIMVALFSIFPFRPASEKFLLPYAIITLSIVTGILLIMNYAWFGRKRTRR